MKREFLKELELEEETIEKIFAEHGKTVNEYKEKADNADTLQSQIDDLNNQIKERDKQLETLQEKAKDNKTLTAEIDRLKQENSDAQKEYDNKIQQYKKESKLELALKDAQAKNPKAVKALLDAEKISLDGDNLIGLEDQLKGLQESDAYLFGEDDPAGLKGRNPHVGDPNKQPPQKNPWKPGEVNLTEQGRILREDPELAKTLQAQA